MKIFIKLKYFIVGALIFSAQKVWAQQSGSSLMYGVVPQDWEPKPQPQIPQDSVLPVTVPESPLPSATDSASMVPAHIAPGQLTAAEPAAKTFFEKIISDLFAGSQYFFYAALAVVVLPIIGYIWYARRGGKRRLYFWFALSPLMALAILLIWYFFSIGTGK
ncbi:MAG: hypothetical protein MUD10_04915 [Candidatus Pacebacteria bacterium]|jgi:hypothetical protein|nr:hypothetical protein [Candidatus Paceibacterota bacterium]